jgi:hypothetical protein
MFERINNQRTKIGQFRIVGDWIVAKPLATIKTLVAPNAEPIANTYLKPAAVPRL